MTKSRILRIQDLLSLINALYPPALAEEWDNVGLQVGDPLAPIERVLVCLDPSEKALTAAREAGAQAVLSHHPLIFRPLKSLAPVDETGRLLFEAIRSGVAFLAAHTNLDRGQNGLNDWLAARIGLQGCKPLALGGGLVKLVVFVPAGYEEPVAAALFDAGAGQVGAYDRCSFRTVGTGTYRPGAGTRPFLGEAGKAEAVRELRLETILPRDRVNRAVARMLKAHPYEEVAYDLVALENRREDVGLGRIGRLESESTAGEMAARIKTALAAPSLRLVGGAERRVSKVALCSGSGAALMHEAVRQGADLFVTGDVKYHEARQVEALGIALIDAGHFPTEHLVVPHLAAALRQEAERRGWPIEFLEMSGEEDPFQTL